MSDPDAEEIAPGKAMGEGIVKKMTNGIKRKGEQGTGQGQGPECDHPV